MKLLLNQNISFRLVRKIENFFPGSSQVKLLGLENKPDFVIWDYAQKEDYCIVTFDSDFYDQSIIKGHPPKLIWIRTENSTTRNLEKLLIEKAAHIRNFADDNEASCLEISELS